MNDMTANRASRLGDHATPLANLRRLWGAVLLTAVSDAVEPATDGDDTLWMNDPDFETVCNHADVDPDKVWKIAQDLLSRGKDFRYTAAMRLRQEAST